MGFGEIVQDGESFVGVFQAFIDPGTNILPVLFGGRHNDLVPFDPGEFRNQVVNLAPVGQSHSVIAERLDRTFSAPSGRRAVRSNRAIAAEGRV